VLLGLPGLAAAQISTVASAEVPTERTVPLEQQVADELASSVYHLGPVRVFPRFLLTNAGYNDNLFGTPPPTTSDWTANLALGLHLLLPVGSKMYLRADALPEYDWYAHHPELRTFGGLYGGDWLGFFNHLTTDVSGSSLKTTAPLSSELQTYVVHHFLTGGAAVQVNLTHRWWLLADGSAQRVEYSSPAPTKSVDGLNRDDFVAHAGILYRWTGVLDVSAKVEGTQSNFAQDAEAASRDNRSSAYLLSVYYRGDRLFVNASGGYRIARPHDSTFTGFSSATESYFVSYYLTRAVELQAYGHRRPDYSLFAGNAYYMETRNALGTTLRLGHRIQLHGFGEYGTNDYPVPVPVPSGLISREDRFTIYGGGLTFLFFRSAALNAQYSKDKISSNYPGVSRSISRFTTNLVFEGKSAP
jgi:hypothetical protein